MEDTMPRSTALRQALDEPKSQVISGNGMMTVPEACQYLRISKWTLYRLIQSKKIRTVKIGSRRLIRKESIVEFVEQLEELQEL
jgi:excisionase family DNA binding protein